MCSVASLFLFWGASAILCCLSVISYCVPSSSPQHCECSHTVVKAEGDGKKNGGHSREGENWEKISPFEFAKSPQIVKFLISSSSDCFGFPRFPSFGSLQRFFAPHFLSFVVRHIQFLFLILHLKLNPISFIVARRIIITIAMQCILHPASPDKKWYKLLSTGQIEISDKSLYFSRKNYYNRARHIIGKSKIRGSDLSSH